MLNLHIIFVSIGFESLPLHKKWLTKAFKINNFNQVLIKIIKNSTIIYNKLMQSGTLLHLALLRKTSNANKRRKGQPTNHKKNYSILPPSDFISDIYTLSGWSTQENQIRAELHPLNNQNNLMRLGKLRQSFEQSHQKVQASRSKIRTSQFSQRPRNRRKSFRNYLHRSVNQTKLENKDHDQKLREITSQISMNPQKKYYKIKIGSSETNRESVRDCKQNESAPQIAKNNQIRLTNNSKFELREIMQSPSFTYNLNYNEIRNRKFFKS